jgi:hypothetical protein
MFTDFVEGLEEIFGLNPGELNAVADKVMRKFSEEVAITGSRSRAMFYTMDYIQSEFAGEENRFAFFILGFTVSLDAAAEEILTKVAPLTRYAIGALTATRGDDLGL